METDYKANSWEIDGGFELANADELPDLINSRMVGNPEVVQPIVAAQALRWTPCRITQGCVLHVT